MILLVLLAAKGWNGFAIMVGVVPLAVILIIVGRSITITYVMSNRSLTIDDHYR